MFLHRNATGATTLVVLEVFGKFVKLEQELLALLQTRVEQDRRMLIEMGGASRV